MTNANNQANAIHYYVNGLVYPHFSFASSANGKWTMLGNPGMVGDNGEYDSPIALHMHPEEWMDVWFGDRWR